MTAWAGIQFARRVANRARPPPRGPSALVNSTGPPPSFPPFSHISTKADSIDHRSRLSIEVAQTQQRTTKSGERLSGDGVVDGDRSKLS